MGVKQGYKTQAVLIFNPNLGGDEFDSDLSHGYLQVNICHKLAGIGTHLSNFSC